MTQPIETPAKKLYINDIYKKSGWKNSGESHGM